MFNLLALKEFLGPLSWFLTLGKSDTDHLRAELQDLLHHTSQSLKSLIELSEALYEIKREDFNMESFAKVYAHCLNNFVGPDSLQKVRTHCTDIQRDLNRINFKVVKYLRAELGTWKNLNNSFRRLADADDDFLKYFQDDMERIESKLRIVFQLLNEGKTDDAWSDYCALRASLLQDHDQVREELQKLAEAENHIRRLLT
jgi:hypothetical protein